MERVELELPRDERKRSFFRVDGFLGIEHLDVRVDSREEVWIASDAMVGVAERRVDPFGENLEVEFLHSRSCHEVVRPFGLGDLLLGDIPA